MFIGTKTGQMLWNAWRVTSWVRPVKASHVCLNANLDSKDDQIDIDWTSIRNFQVGSKSDHVDSRGQRTKTSRF